MGEYASDFYAAAPALTSHRYGSGRAYYLGTICEQTFYDDWLRNLSESLEIEELGSGPASLEVVRRVKNAEEIIFMINHDSDAVILDLDAEYWSVLEAKVLSGSLDLEPYGVKILRKHHRE